MLTFKKIVLNTLTIGLLAVALMSTSCNKDDAPVSGCTDPLAETYNPDADIDDGSCVYARDKFIGSYDVVSDDCEAGTYNIRIDPSAQAVDKILINNLNDLSGLTLTGNVSSSSFIMKQANYNGQLISGNGQLNGSVLSITYLVVNPDGYSFSCNVSANLK
jgi:hypothetical protein